MIDTISPLLNFTDCYIIGIKGVGMTGLAQCLLDQNIRVSGCDVPEHFVTEKILSSLNISIETFESASLPPTIDCVIYGSAHQGIEHPIVQEAIKRKIKIFSHAQVLGLLSQEKQTVAVCGVGGKSTTSAWLAWTLEQIGAQPSYQVGVGEILGLPKTGRWNTAGSLFIVEADEYAENPLEVAKGASVIPRFHYLQPQTIVCTNLLYDHPDVYSSFASTEATFYEFFCQIESGGTIIWNADDAHLQQLIKKITIDRPDVVSLSFGTTPLSNIEIKDLGYQDGNHHAQFIAHGPVANLQDSPILSLSLPGLHNLQNAAAVWILTCLLNYKPKRIAQHLTSFQSTSRRFQLIHQHNATFYYDDYAHHPTEVAAALSACKAKFPNSKIVVIFQPHTFSRTQALLADFASAFTQADILILAPIFGSARESGGGITIDEFASKIKSHQNTNMQVLLAKSLDDAAELVNSIDTSEAVVLTLGAGDVYTLHDLIRKETKP